MKQRGAYFINFQDPGGSPTFDPLTVNGNEYLKIGWNTYDEILGYGWYGDMAHVMYRYLSRGPNELQKSIIYDDWGRVKTFEFDLPNGTYDVTVSVGWQDRLYSHNKIDIEGVSFVIDEATNPYLVRSKTITVADNKLTMSMGFFDEYTMLNYLDIQAAEQIPGDPVALFYADTIKGTAPFTVNFHDSSVNNPTAWQWNFDNNGSIDSITRNPTHTYTTPGTNDVKLIVSGANGGTDELVKVDYVVVEETGQSEGGEDFPWVLFVPVMLGN